MKNKTNISILDNVGVRRNASIEVGANGNNESGLILDANAVESLIDNKVDEIIGDASDALDTLKELGDALPTKVSDLQNDAGYIKESDLSSINISTFVNNAGYLTQHQDISGKANQSDVTAIEEKIPSQASSENKLADKLFVNSSISTNTADFKGTYDITTDLSDDISNLSSAIATAGYSTPNNNDYCFVITEDNAGNTIYDRYKYTVVNNVGSWDFEYSLNNSSFTSDQWGSISSGITSSLVSKLSALPNNSDLSSSISGKQDSLVSGNNIKTINNTTVLGSGNFNLVESTDVRNIVVLTQAQYDALATKDANTEYNII